MAVPLLEHLPEVCERIARAAHLLVLLDFDGTLTPIVDRPDDARLEPATRAALAVLARRPHTTVAIMSGRAREDVQARVGLDGLIYAGNHGLEIKGPGLYLLRTAPGAVQGRLQDLAGDLSERFRGIPGVLVENKGLTLSIHHRLVPPDRLEEYCRCVRQVVNGLASSFQMTAGKKVHEIRPRVDWNKGTASAWIRKRLGGAGILPVYVGDDRTDEDAFAALRDGITVKVGGVNGTVAGYSLADPVEVAHFLEWLSGSNRDDTRTDPGPGAAFSEEG